MLYNVISGDICEGILYNVAGGQSVVYNRITYNTGQYFRGGGIKTFLYTGSGSQILNEILELNCAAIEFVEVSDDQPVFDDIVIYNAISLQYELTDAEKKVIEITKMQGFALELVDYPFYSFEITETRL